MGTAERLYVTPKKFLVYIRTTLKEPFPEDKLVDWVGHCCVGHVFYSHYQTLSRLNVWPQTFLQTWFLNKEDAILYRLVNPLNCSEDSFHVWINSKQSGGTT